jgi:hypothetical protein
LICGLNIFYLWYDWYVVKTFWLVTQEIVILLNTLTYGPNIYACGLSIFDLQFEHFGKWSKYFGLWSKHFGSWSKHFDL